MPRGAEDLNAYILAAHARRDHTLLIDLYTQAADVAEDENEECFFLTYAHVFSLELGCKCQIPLQARLRAYGRE